MKIVPFSVKIVLPVFFFLSCTLTTTKPKTPIFIDQAKVENELVNLVKSENINLNGQEITRNKKSTSELEISITNGKDLPANEDKMKSVGKSIAVCVKKNLKDINQFDTYKVLFVTEVENSGVTKRTWKGNVFSSAEL